MRALHAPGSASREDSGRATDRGRALEAFFRGFGFTDPVEIGRLIDRVAAGAVATPAEAVARAERQVAAWVRTVLGLGTGPDWQVTALGRAAFLRAEGARHWPDRFLAAGDPPAALVAALRRELPVAVPEPVPAAMPEQSLDPITLPYLVRRLFPPSQPKALPRRI